MKKIVFSFAIACLSLAVFSCGSKNKSEETDIKDAQEGGIVMKVEPSSASLKWEGSKPAGKHYGKVNMTEAELRVEKGALIGGKFVVDLKTMTCEDLDAENGGKLVGHLLSPDFFNADTFQTASFEITGVELLPEPTAEGYTHKVSGNMTIKNITKGIAFNAMINVTEESVMAKSNFSIERTQFNLVYGSKTVFKDLGDKFIDDEFKLEFDLTAKK